MKRLVFPLMLILISARASSMVVISSKTTPVLSQSNFALPHETYKLIGSFDLNNQNIVLPFNCKLIVKKSVIANGVLVGDNTSLKAKKAVAFSNVRLEGTWCGHIDDRNFAYEIDGKNHYDIVASLLKFNNVSFSREKYYINSFNKIYLNSGNVNIDGHGTTWIFCPDKGPIKSTDWGDKYVGESFVSSSGQDGSTIEIKNINIIDNELNHPVIYYYFYLCNSFIRLKNVNSTGCGGLLGGYNTRLSMKGIEIENCTVVTSNFAVELANRTVSNSNGTNENVHISNCSFHRFPNAMFVGPISLVGDSGSLKKAIIENSTFVEEKVGNIELSGVGEVQYMKNEMTNVFLYSGSNPPIKMECRQCKFILKQPAPDASYVLQVAARTVLIENNKFLIESSFFPRIDLLYPDQTESFSFINNEIRYEPQTSGKHMQYLFSFPSIRGTFTMKSNSVVTNCQQLQFRNNYPKKHGEFEDPFEGKTKNDFI